MTSRRQVEPSVLLPQELGNSYTASMYTGLLSLIHNWHKPKQGAQIDTEASTKGKQVGLAQVVVLFCSFLKERAGTPPLIPFLTTSLPPSLPPFSFSF